MKVYFLYLRSWDDQSSPVLQPQDMEPAASLFTGQRKRETSDHTWTFHCLSLRYTGIWHTFHWPEIIIWLCLLRWKLRNVGDTMGYWIWWALLSLLQGQRGNVWAYLSLGLWWLKKKNKFTGSMRLETSLELEDEWKLTMLCASWISIYIVVYLVKNLPAMWETWVWSLGWEDPLEKGKTIHSSVLA